MPKLKTKIGEWDLPNLDLWDERSSPMRFANRPWLTPESKIFVVGACTAVWMSATLRRLGFQVTTHPDGHFYNSRSVLQAVEVAAGKREKRDREPIWRTTAGYMDPFAHSYQESLPSEGEVLARRDVRDLKSQRMLHQAGVVILGIELAEAWFSATENNALLMLPPPEVYEALQPTVRTLSAEEMASDLRQAIRVIRAASSAKVLLMTTGIPLHATFTTQDVSIASMSSITACHAAVSAVAREDPEVGFFPAADILYMSGHPARFFTQDRRHLTPDAVRFLTGELVAAFGHPDGAARSRVPSPLGSDPAEREQQEEKVRAPTETEIRAYLAKSLRKTVRRLLPTRMLPRSVRTRIGLG